MSAKCSVCKRAFVNNPGEVCITCKLRQQSGTVHMAPVLPADVTAGVSGTVQEDKQNVVSTTPKVEAGGCYVGIVQNVRQRKVERSGIERWLRTVWQGIPFVLSNERYEFNLYTQGNYTAEQVQGYNVVFYGEAEYSFLSDNAKVKVYGKPDRNGVIAAREIRGINTAFRMKPRFAVPAVMVRIFSLFLAALAAAGIAGLVYSVRSSGAEDGILFMLAMFVGAALVIKFKRKKRFWTAAILASVGILAVSPSIGCLGIMLLLLIKIFLVH